MADSDETRQPTARTDWDIVPLEVDIDELLPNQRAFLVGYIKSGANVTAAANAAEIHRCMHYEWLADDQRHSAYAEAFAHCHAAAVERMELEADRRAIDGWNEPIYYEGERVGWRRRYSDQLLIKRLEAAAPDKYAQRRYVDQRNLNVNVNVDELRDNVRTAIDQLVGDLPELGSGNGDRANGDSE